MPWQLIYTSAPRGLVSGQSGFCTVARSADLREALAQRLEQLSAYHYLELSGGAPSRRNPTISAYRILDVRGTRYHALSRLQPCGLDFTARTNHLAHHLVFSAEEVAGLPSPAAILRHWGGWLCAWDGEPRLLEPVPMETFTQIPGPQLPAATWQQLTGDAGRAAGLLESELARGCYLLYPAGAEQQFLECLGETLQLLNPAGESPLRAWQYTFTTFLQGEDAVADFTWRGCQENTPASELAPKRSARLLPLGAIPAPDNPLAKLAREGPLSTTALTQPAPRARHLRPSPAAPLTAAELAGNVQAGAERRALTTKSFPFAWPPGASLKGLLIALTLSLGLILLKFLWR
jgi:GTPase-associated protein 1, N-terminal domain type 2